MAQGHTARRIELGSGVVAAHVFAPRHFAGILIEMRPGDVVMLTDPPSISTTPLNWVVAASDVKAHRSLCSKTNAVFACRPRSRLSWRLLMPLAALTNKLKAISSVRTGSF